MLPREQMQYLRAENKVIPISNTQLMKTQIEGTKIYSEEK